MDDNTKCFVCKKPSEYLIGASLYSWKRKLIIKGGACCDHVADGITKMGEGTFGTPYWPAVANMDGKLIYHSFAADQDGLSHLGGWKLKKAELERIDGRGVKSGRPKGSRH